jgi:hypothetical protein
MTEKKGRIAHVLAEARASLLEPSRPMTPENLNKRATSMSSISMGMSSIPSYDAMMEWNQDADNRLINEIKAEMQASRMNQMGTGTLGNHDGADGSASFRTREDPYEDMDVMYVKENLMAQSKGRGKAFGPARHHHRHHRHHHRLLPIIREVAAAVLRWRLPPEPRHRRCFSL